jgi:mannose-6-phosphate isomerase
MSKSPTLGPLIFTPVPSERIWGVRSLEPWFPVRDAPMPIGEMWLTAEDCPILSGPLAGSSLREATALHPALLAEPGLGTFPLLIKILFPADKLSVQVHPDDEQAVASGELRGKTECWYVLTADPGATVAVGFREPTTTEQIRAAIADGSLEERMAHLPVKAGDMVFVDAGTVHAIGPGVIILETQEYSDITYRLFDYGRPRELHLEQGLAVTRTETSAGLVAPIAHGTHTELVRSLYFTVDSYKTSADLASSKLQILIALTEDSRLIGPGGVLALPKSHAVILPAEDEAYRLEPAGEVIRIRP